jgi:hypothetical protein
MNRPARRKGVELTIIVNNLWNYEYKNKSFRVTFMHDIIYNFVEL